MKWYKLAAISIESFGNVEGFKLNVDAVSRVIRQSALLPGAEAIRLAGDAASAKQKDRLAQGVPVKKKFLLS